MLLKTKRDIHVTQIYTLPPPHKRLYDLLVLNNLPLPLHINHQHTGYY